MDKRSADYLKQHIWNIVQTFSGLGCLVLEGLAYRNLRAIQSGTASPVVGAAMTPPYSMPWYLWAGITVLAFSVIIPAVMGMVRKHRSPTKLKIVSATYGVKGGPDEDVADKYLRPRIAGDALAGYVGSDLFGAFDPAIGKHKRVKIRYSYAGREETIERGENELLVLPEDPHLKQASQAADEAEADQLRREEIQRKAELWRAQESRRICDEERREALRQLEEAKSQLALFTPLQIEAFQLAKDLRLFLKELGPRPQVSWGNLDPQDGMAKRMTEQNRLQQPWVAKLVYRYAREYAPRVKNLMLRIGETGLPAFQLGAYADGIVNEENVLTASNLLDGLAVQMNYSDLQIVNQAQDTWTKVQNMGSEEYRRALEVPGFGDMVDKTHAEIIIQKEEPK
jgi:hypothetical protein